MAQFNLNAYYLKDKFDRLLGAEPKPEDMPEQADDLTIDQRPTENAAHNSALAGTQVAGATPIRGGKFAPRATSGMR